MKHTQTDELIRDTAKRLFAANGYDGVSMRILSKESGVGLSSIYHFFKDKDILLRTVYEDTNRSLGVMRNKLPAQLTVGQSLRQLIDFQFEHIQDVVYVLKYYLTFRSYFASLPTKTLPAKSVLHVQEVLEAGVKSGELELKPLELEAKAKVIAHTINGYMLEYYPAVPVGKERQAIADDIVSFTLAALNVK